MRVRFDPVSICQKLELLHMHACLRRNMTCHIKMQPALRTNRCNYGNFSLQQRSASRRERPCQHEACVMSPMLRRFCRPGGWLLLAFIVWATVSPIDLRPDFTSGSGLGAGSCFWHGWAFIRARLPSLLVADQPRACRFSRGDRASAASYTRQACRFWGYRHQNCWGNSWISSSADSSVAWLSLAPHNRT